MNCPHCDASQPSLRASELLLRCAACGTEFVADNADTLELSTICGAGEAQRIAVLSLAPSFRERYRLRSLIGRGGFGMVLSAHRISDGLPVAVKFLIECDQPNHLERFVREARSLESLHHPNVIRLIEVGTLEQFPYMVTEFVGGGNLRQKLKTTGRIDVETLLRLAADCLAGLGACHARGIIHRDVKPENILLTEDGTAKIADLGIVKDQANLMPLTMEGKMMGTPRYMAPEQILGDQLTPVSDLYSLGLVLYEAIAGRFPHDGHQLVEHLQFHQHGKPFPLAEIVPEVPEELSRIIHQVLAKEPAERFGSALAMAQALERLSIRAPKPDVEVPAEPAAAPARLEPRPVRRPGPRPVAVARGPVSGPSPPRTGTLAVLTAGVLAGMLGLSYHFFRPGVPLPGRTAPPSVSSLIARAQQAQSQRLYIEATTLLDEAELREPTNLSVYIARSRIYLETRELEKAERDVQKLRALNSKIAASYYLMGQIRLAQKRYGDAVNETQQAIQLKPGFDSAYIQLGNIRWAERNAKAAESAFRGAISINPSTWPPYLGLARLYTSEKNLDEAYRNYETALRVSPGNGMVRREYSDLLSRNGLTMKAKQILKITHAPAKQ